MGFLLEFERIVHWVVWSSSCVYSIYCFCRASRKYSHQLDSQDFGPGWNILEYDQDISDFEWTTFRLAWNRFWFWIIGQTLISAVLIKLKYSKSILLTYMILSSFGFIFYVQGYKVLFIYISNVTLSLMCSLTGRRLLAYSLPILVLLTQTLYNLYQDANFEYKESLFNWIIFEVGLGWLNMRCISFANEIISQSKCKLTVKEILDVFAYSFYLPCFYTGPIMLFNNFEEQLASELKSTLFSNPLKLLFNTIGYVFYYYALELATHFCYSSAFQFYPHLVNELDSWTLCGLGYALPSLFYLKYKLIYGFAGFISEIQGISVPPPPKCVSRCHTSSFLWKHFDRGLYLWILRYLYIPLVGPSKSLIRRVLSSSVCFTFMAIWHGLHFTINFWCFLNYAGVTLEMAGAALGKKILEKLNWHPSDTMFRRLQALAGAPCFIHMCISNIFFMSNYDVGILYWEKIVFGFPIPLLSTLFVMYCGSHVSIEFTKWEEQRKLKASADKTK